MESRSDEGPELRLPPTPAEWEAVKAERDHYKSALESLQLLISEANQANYLRRMAIVAENGLRV